MRHGRLPWFRPTDLDAEQKSFYDKIVASPRANANRPTPLVDDEGRFHGPFNAMLTNPQLCDSVQAIGSALRFAGDLPREIFEGIVLMVAAERHASYEWYAHAPIALRRGLTDTDLEAIRTGTDADLDTSIGADVVALVRATLAHEQPTEETVRAVEERFGASGVTEIVVVVCFYDTIATLMRTWDSPLPVDTDPLEA
jgi:alkylhydroperoxidase family enzyme